MNGNGSATCSHGQADDRDRGGCGGDGGSVAALGAKMISRTLPDCQGNFVNVGVVCDLDVMTVLCRGVVDVASKSNSSEMQRQKVANENTINRLLAMAMSDDDDYVLLPKAGFSQVDKEIPQNYANTTTSC
ncbi:uncharacterized protein LOC118738225 [Rhagoletis pomonella]|uniref:uncharacterized protein LOC118738225 n=1 Tax=Rhagoletis pomonella TaxID=28610 RepID=UPI001780655F|nr:uncharacterized protein LOC118738225 [Rhagoletis pomonella]